MNDIKTITSKLKSLLADKKTYEAKVKAIKKEVEFYKDELASFMSENALEELKQGGIKATRGPKERYLIDDYEEVADFIVHSGDVEIFERRLSKAYIDSYLEEHDELPPGIDVDEYVETTVKLAGGKK